MDGIECIRNYMDRILCGDNNVEGMKVLILDGATTQIVSCVYSQTEILSNEVYLVSRLDDFSSSSGGGPKKSCDGIEAPVAEASTAHLKAICFIRPTEVNIGLLLRELNCPRYSEYHLYFSAIVTSGHLRLLAEADIYERVRRIQELYADFVPLNSDLCTLQCRNTLPMTVAAGTSWAPQHAHLYERNLQGLQSLLLALKRSPYAIRYAKNSSCAQELANDLADAIKQDDIFHFRSKASRSNRVSSHRGHHTGHNNLHQPFNTNNYINSVSSGGGTYSGDLLVVILDRRDDPVTPLLSQWTYQAMVHELLGLNNHRVILKGAPNVPKDLEEVVLGGANSGDSFYQQNKHNNFGQLGESIQQYLQEYQKKTQNANKLKESLNSIQDMQQFMEKFPELRTQSHHVSKHVAIMGELSRLVDICKLMDVSQFEQELACNDDHSSHWTQLMDKLLSDDIKIPDKLRLSLLYALRYESSPNANIPQMLNIMSKGGVPQDMINLVTIMLRYGGVQSRGPGLYGEHQSTLSKMTKNFITSVQGIQNIYAQHEPLLMDTINSIIRGVNSNVPPTLPDIIPKEILIFMVGGVTYEEGTKIAQFNMRQQQSNNPSNQPMGNASSSSSANNQGIRVILAGSTVHNSTSFLEELKQTF